MSEHPAKDYEPDRACPLDGVRVLDLSRLIAGNMLTLQLADFGAEVIKLEPEAGDPLRHWREQGVSAYWKVYGRNKKSVRLDLKSDSGKRRFRQLLGTARILVESFRPGVMEALGFGPDQVLAINPKIVFVRISGWGQTGTYRERPGFGALVEAASGFAAKNGFADKPPVLPNMALADMVAGLSGAFATMVALREAERPDGRGQAIDLSLLEPLHSILGPDAALHRLTGKVMPRSGNHASITAPRNIYRTSNGGWVALAASTEAMVKKLFAAIGWPELYDDPRFSTNAARLAHVDEIDALVQAFIAKQTVEENAAFFAREGVTVGPVYDSETISRDPHVVARAVLVELPDAEMGSVPMHNVVPRLSATPGALRRPAPALGQHEAEIFNED